MCIRDRPWFFSPLFPTHFFKATRGDRDAPYSNRRRGRVAPEQGYRLALGLACFRSLPRDRARKLRKRRTRNSRLCLVVLCLGSSRRCLCSSPRLLRRLRCLRLSLLTRFPFLVSQVLLHEWLVHIVLAQQQNKHSSDEDESKNDPTKQGERDAEGGKSLVA